MPYKDIEAKRKHDRDYIQKVRGATPKDDKIGTTPVSVTPLPPKITNILRADEHGKYPAVLYALTDSVKRRKLEKITQSLKIHKQAENVYYGYPRLGGVPFDVIGDLLEATQ